MHIFDQSVEYPPIFICQPIAITQRTDVHCLPQKCKIINYECSRNHFIIFVILGWILLHMIMVKMCLYFIFVFVTHSTHPHAWICTVTLLLCTCETSIVHRWSFVSICRDVSICTGCILSIFNVLPPDRASRCIETDFADHQQKQTVTTTILVFE